MHKLRLFGAAMRSAQIAGAYRVLDITLQYTQERVQFGKPISKFQAIQHNLAMLAAHSAAANAAADMAAEAAGRDMNELAIDRRQDAVAGGERQARRSRTRRTAPSASRTSTSCISSRNGCGRGATNSARKRLGVDHRSRQAAAGRKDLVGHRDGGGRDNDQST